MASFIQLTELIPVETPLGRGWAILVQAEAHDQWWTVVLDDGGGIVCFSHADIRAQNSYTHGRGISDEKMREIVRPKK